ncbi:MAG: tRNA (adenosine(37)-N6)-threonylcarbamoyltransferase complex dimerization subunit type 1 TsaB [Candidatus Geothermincolales bacterium]
MMGGADGAILALDLSYPAGVVTLSHEGRISWRRVEGGRRAADLFPLLSEVLAESGVERECITVIGAGRGPGAFTGVRVAVTAAKFLAWAWELSLVAPTSLEAMAFSWRGDGLVCPCMDARRREFYFGLYRREGDLLEVLEGPLLGPEGTLREKMEAWSEEYRDDLFLVGYPDRSIAADLPAKEILPLDGPTPEGLVKAVSAHLREERFVRPLDLLPLYLRRPDAEERRCREGR